MKEKLKSIAIITLLAMSMVVAANATTLSDTISSFTGTLRVAPVDASTALTIDQNYDSVGLNIDSESTTQPSFLAYSGSGSTNYFYTGDLDSLYNTRFYNNIASSNNLVTIQQDNAGASGDVLQILNDGTGNGLIIDQNGDGDALIIDSEATDGKYALLAKTASNNFAFGVTEETSVNAGNTMVLGGYHLWVDATGDLRIKSSAPTSDTDGAIVGTQS